MATALLEIQDASQREAAETERGNDSLPDYWTVDALYKAIDAGVFKHPERLELVHGRIIDKMPQNAPHASSRRRLGRLLRSAMGPLFLVMEESPLRLALDGEPIPDILVATGREEEYEREHPTQATVVLVVEVSSTTNAFDLGEKALLYAEANIQDYWLVLVNEAAIMVHREPTSEGYGSVTRLAGQDMLAPLAVLAAAWTIDALLGRTEEV